MSMEDVPTIEDPAAMIRDLELMWQTCQPQQWNGEACEALFVKADQVGATENPYWDIVRNLPVDQFCLYDNHPLQVDPFKCKRGPDYLVDRHQLTKTFGWSIPTPGDIEWITSVLGGRGVVEIGAGTGYWAWQLAQAGADVVAVDLLPGGENTYCAATQYHPVHRGGPEVAGLHPERALLLCWPPYGARMAVESLRAYEGDLLIWIGEGDGGCTGDEEFFRVRDAGWEHIGDSPAHVTFSGIHCFVEAYRRKGGQP